mgnify:CR=1 FL=1
MNDQIARLDDRLRARRESFDRIPVVDISGLIDGTARERVAREINAALRSAGFMYVKGHGISQAFIDRVFEVTRAFFDLPLEDKMAVVRPAMDVTRGYIPIETEAVAASRGEKTVRGNAPRDSSRGGSRRWRRCRPRRP